MAQGQVSRHLPGRTFQGLRGQLPGAGQGQSFLCNVWVLDHQRLWSQPELTWICVKNEQASKPPSGPETEGELGSGQGGDQGPAGGGVCTRRGGVGCIDPCELRLIC